MTLSYRHPASSESEGKKNMIKACAHSPSWENYVYWDYSKSKSFTQSKSQEKHKAMIMSSIVILSPTSQASLTEKQKYPAHYAGPGVLPLTHSLSQSVIWVCKRHSQWKNGRMGKWDVNWNWVPRYFAQSRMSLLRYSLFASLSARIGTFKVCWESKIDRSKPLLLYVTSV